MQDGRESGQLRTLIPVLDCRTFLGIKLVSKMPTRYFDIAVDFRWTRASKIIPASGIPETDKLQIGIIAAEELTEDEFNDRMEQKAAEDMLKIAKSLINPSDEQK
jgi:hypothetical protein